MTSNHRAMPTIDPATRSSIELHFHGLIRRRAEEFGIDVAQLPDLSCASGTRENPAYFPVPGMHGGFAYWFEGEGQAAKLVTESWSRVVGGSGERHEIEASGMRLIDVGFV